MLEYSVLNNLENKNTAHGEDETLMVFDMDVLNPDWRDEDTQSSDPTNPPNSPLIKMTWTQRESQSYGGESKRKMNYG